MKWHKIKVTNPAVELDGDEMARVMWSYIKNELMKAWPLYLSTKNTILSRGLAFRGRLNSNNELVMFAQQLENAVVESAGTGMMTKDMASLVKKENLQRADYITTIEFIREIKERLNYKLKNES
jgi:isocitrate dehydrogenase